MKKNLRPVLSWMIDVLPSVKADGKAMRNHLMNHATIHVMMQTMTMLVHLTWNQLMNV